MQTKIASWPWGKDLAVDYRAKIWLALTHSMLYYNREDVIRWREWAIRKDATIDSLHRDREALVVIGCEKLSESLSTSSRTTKLKVLYEYNLDEGQTCFLKPGGIFVRFSQGANQQDTDYGKLIEINGNKIIFERESEPEDVNLAPNAIFVNEWIPLGQKPATVGDLVQQLTMEWKDPNQEPKIQHPAMDLLMRHFPRLKSLNQLPEVENENYLDAISKACFDLNNSVLAIQGPPGSGKTYLGSRVIKQLVDAGFSVGVVANSHSAVENLLRACIDAGVSEDLIAKRNQTGDKSPKPWFHPSTNAQIASWRSELYGSLIGGTSWNFCSKEFMERSFDYIFIDEAAQFSLVDAIAVSANSKNLVLLGDPRQLTQVVQAIHPGGVDNSALGHYMGNNAILEKQKGYFVSITRRLHPKINAPVSWLSYQGQLHSHPDTENFLVEGTKPGITLLEVSHFGNSSSSIEEAEVVLKTVSEQLQVIPASEILVVSPYNAQVDLIRTLLDEAGFPEVACGTVDKFQGREALVVIFSMAASSSEDAPR
ncbi:MAG: DEAD/DEAH box helicase, partial [Actinomycetota bacterium]